MSEPFARGEDHPACGLCPSKRLPREAFVVYLRPSWELVVPRSVRLVVEGGEPAPTSLGKALPAFGRRAEARDAFARGLALGAAADLRSVAGARLRLADLDHR